MGNGIPKWLAKGEMGNFFATLQLKLSERTPLLVAVLTTPCLTSSSHKLCIYNIPVSGQLQLQTLFLLPEGVQWCPLTGALTEFCNGKSTKRWEVTKEG